jgi:hypothetical protein
MKNKNKKLKTSKKSPRFNVMLWAVERLKSGGESFIGRIALTVY